MHGGGIGQTFRLGLPQPFEPARLRNQSQKIRCAVDQRPGQVVSGTLMRPLVGDCQIEFRRREHAPRAGPDQNPRTDDAGKRDASKPRDFQDANGAPLDLAVRGDGRQPHRAADRSRGTVNRAEKQQQTDRGQQQRHEPDLFLGPRRFQPGVRGHENQRGHGE